MNVGKPAECITILQHEAIFHIYSKNSAIVIAVNDFFTGWPALRAWFSAHEGLSTPQSQFSANAGSAEHQPVMLSSDCSATGDADVCAVIGAAGTDGGSLELQPPRNTPKMVIESDRDIRLSVMKQDRIFSLSTTAFRDHTFQLPAGTPTCTSAPSCWLAS
jgi:hypothetical protein